MKVRGQLYTLTGLTLGRSFLYPLSGALGWHQMNVDEFYLLDTQQNLLTTVPK